MDSLTKTKIEYLIARTFGSLVNAKSGMRVLTYHGVQKSVVNSWQIDPDLFEQHMRYIAENGYSCYRVSDIAQDAMRSKTFSSAEKSVAITFDDGLFNNYSIARPILKKFGLTATFFVPSAYILDTRLLIDDRHIQMAGYRGLQMMAWSDLRDLIEEGFEVGAHSHSHILLGSEDVLRASREVDLPKRILEDRLQTSILSFAYPKGRNGSFSTTTRTLLANSGYKVGCTMLEGVVLDDTDMLTLPRNSITGTDILERFAMKLSGRYDCLRLLRQIKGNLL